MNTLLFDAGNSRVKWALVRNGVLGALHATPLAGMSSMQGWLARTPGIERVAGVCVAGGSVERNLRAMLRRARLPAPQFLTSTGEAAGVRNGYREPWRLGADRWAAAVGAWHLAGCYRTVCAVSVGTALTIDLVDHDGVHRGGLIAPGPELMLASLLRNTHGIARRAAGSRGTRRTVGALADNTQGAIEAGCLCAAAAVIDRTIGQLTRELGVRPVIFLTGGGADSIQPLLKGAIRPCPELVLRGVAAIAAIPVRRRTPRRRARL